MGIASVADEPSDALPTGLARLVEHDTGLVLRVCHGLTVLDYGEVIARGEPAAVRDDPVVQAAYLGEAPREGPAPAVPAGSPVPVAPPGPAVGITGTATLSTNPPFGTGNPPTPVPDPPAPTPAPALVLSDVRAAYGRIEVLHGVSLSVGAGSVHALLGPNGAGKSTLLKVVSGRLPATGGTVAVGGQVRRRLAPEQLVGTLADGGQQMLSLVRALYTEPSVLLLDEISMGLAPLIVAELYELVGELVREEHLTIILVEQFAKTALELADRASVMMHGEIVQEGSPAELEEVLVDAYLGGGAP